MRTVFNDPGTDIFGKRVFPALLRISRMFTAGSRYQNNAKGLKPGNVETDDEGIDAMCRLGENIAWFIKKYPSIRAKIQYGPVRKPDEGQQKKVYCQLTDTMEECDDISEVNPSIPREVKC